MLTRKRRADRGRRQKYQSHGRDTRTDILHSVGFVMCILLEFVVVDVLRQRIAPIFKDEAAENCSWIA